MKIIKKILIGLTVTSIGIVALLLLHPGSKKKVIEILADVPAYELSKFYPSSLSQSTFSAITAQDSGPISFKKMQLELDVMETQSGGAISYQVSTSYNNAGNSFVQITSETKNNNITHQLSFALSYRGLFTLKQQQVVLSKEKSESLWRLASVSQFTPITPAAKQVVLIGKGKPVQPNNFHSECSINEQGSAKAIFHTLEGLYLDVHCKFYNENKVAVHAIESAYLLDYGIAIPLTEYSVAFKKQFYITNVNISR